MHRKVRSAPSGIRVSTLLCLSDLCIFYHICPILYEPTRLKVIEILNHIDKPSVQKPFEMDSLHTLSFPFLLAVLTCMLQSSFAQSTGTTPTPSATATPSVTASYGSQATSNYPSGGADGPGTVANPVPTTTAEQNDAGASGRSSGSFNLSVGALVAIGIIVGVVVLVASKYYQN